MGLMHRQGERLTSRDRPFPLHGHADLTIDRPYIRTYAKNASSRFR